MEKLFKRRIPQCLFIVIGMLMIVGVLPQTAQATTNTVSDGQSFDISTCAAGDTVNVDAGATATLTGSQNVQISCGEGVTLTLDSVTSDVSACALSFSGIGNILIINGTNTLKSGSNKPGIQVETGTELEIKGDGILNVTGGKYAAGIGGGYQVTGGTISILEGSVTATGGYAGSGIGGGDYGAGGTFTISGGSVTATGGYAGSGIGGGYNAAGGTITITDGSVTATGGDEGGAGIGSGDWEDDGKHGDGGTITISGGTVTATGGSKGAGIGGGNGAAGGTITISNGKVTATGGDSGSGIGGGNGGAGGEITIDDGEVTAIGKKYGAGIGGGKSGAGGEITINDGTVKATGGSTPSLWNGGGGAGIGGGAGAVGGTITISNGNVTATGGESAAGIGGGSGKVGGTITISNGKVTATGGEYGAGIGGGSEAQGGKITINSGTVTARGGDLGAGIGGGGFAGHGGTITITDGTVTATGGNGAGAYGGGAGIGGGSEGDTGTILIKGGKVFAVGSEDIGHGTGGHDNSFSLSGDALVFLAHDSCTTPDTETHTHFPKSGPLYGFSLPGWSDAGIYALAYTLTYYDNVGSDSKIENVPQVGTATLEDSSVFENPGYTFKEWNTEADDSGTSYAPGDNIRISDDLTLYAIWTLETAAMVDSISPANSDAPLDGNVVITFNNDNMDTTVTGTVTINGTPLSGGVWSNDSRTYTIPYSSLAYYQSYTIDISGFKNTDYITMEAATASFTTEAPADLLSLTVNSGSLSPAFDTNTAAYRVDATDIDSIGITAQTLDPGASLTINGVEATSGSETSVSLINGANMIPVVITAQDGSSKAYIISVTKTADDADLVIDANLASLLLNSGPLNPDFDSGTTTYYASVGSDVDTIKLTASASDEKAVMLLNGTILSQGDSQTIPLSLGDNEVKLVVVAQDASTQTYSLTINRKNSDKIICSYQTHVENIGWQGFVSDGEISGTQGQSLRLEGIKIELEDQENLGIEYSTYVENIGWQNFAADGEMSGTQGQALRLEAIKINLTGEDVNNYDIYYQVHAQNFAWLDWAKNGEAAGTAGLGYRLEAIKIVVVPKGQAAPGDTYEVFVQS